MIKTIQCVYKCGTRVKPYSATLFFDVSDVSAYYQVDNETVKVYLKCGSAFTIQVKDFRSFVQIVSDNTFYAIV